MNRHRGGREIPEQKKGLYDMRDIHTQSKTELSRQPDILKVQRYRVRGFERRARG